MRLQEVGQGFHRHVVLLLVAAPGEACAHARAAAVRGDTAALTAPRGRAASEAAQHQPTPSFSN